MEKRKFNQLRAADRHMLIDLLVQAGLIDYQGYVTERGEEVIVGENPYGSLSRGEVLGTDIMPGYVRLTYKLTDEWIASNTKSDQLAKSLGAAEFNTDVVGKAVVYVFDTDIYDGEALLLGEPGDES